MSGEWDAECRGDQKKHEDQVDTPGTAMSLEPEGFSASATLPKVAIVTLNYKGLAETVECLNSLRALDYPNRDIVVIDNGSGKVEIDRLSSECRGFARLIINDRNLGFAGGMNVGMQWGLEQGARYVWILHNDTVVDSPALRNLVSAAEAAEVVGMAGPAIYNPIDDDPSQVPVFSSGRFDWFLGAPFPMQFSGDRATEVDFVAENGPLVKCEVLRRVGFFDEKFFMHYVDLDFCTRCKRAGFKVVYVPGAKIVHKYAVQRIRILNRGESGGWDLLGRLSLSMRNHFRFLHKHSSIWLTPFQAIAYFGFVLPRFICVGLRQPHERRYLRGVFQALLMMLRRGAASLLQRTRKSPGSGC